MSQNHVSRVVLVTGCSSGIGRATALRLAAAGWLVYATARRQDSLIELAERECRTVALDVTDETSIRKALSQIEAEAGAVGVLINNAGYHQPGAVEALTPACIRKQFETNVFGPIRLAQLVLPGMRQQKWGKIVNISSIGGKLTLPGGGAYHGAKHALEAFSDALRYEVSEFGINVIVIEPGLIRTGFVDAALSVMEESDEPYTEFHQALAAQIPAVYEKGLLAKLGGSPEAVARIIQKAIGAKRPKTRYRVTASAGLLLGVRAMLSDRMWDTFLRSQFPVVRHG